MREPDFLNVIVLAELTGYEPKTLYNAHSAGRGPLSEILTKLGGRVGAWRADYVSWRDAQRMTAA